jgi:hypothetical protein
MQYKFCTYHTYHTLFIYSFSYRGMSDITLRRPGFAIQSQSISDVSAVNTLVAFYDILGRKVSMISYIYLVELHTTVPVELKIILSIVLKVQLNKKQNILSHKLFLSMEFYFIIKLILL